MMTPEELSKLKATAREGISQNARMIRFEQEFLKLVEENVMLRKQLRELADDELRALWDQLEAGYRQIKALWLRTLLADYEF